MRLARITLAALGNAIENGFRLCVAEPGGRLAGREIEHCAAAVEKARIDSPRGAFTLGQAHGPVQDIGVRPSAAKQDRRVGVASKYLAEPARGGKL